MHLPSEWNGKSLEGMWSGGSRDVSNAVAGQSSALVTIGRKRRHLDDCYGDIDKKATLRLTVMPNTPLTPRLLPAKRRRCLQKSRESFISGPSSLDEPKWKGYRDVTEVIPNKPKKQKPSLTKPVADVERRLNDPITKEDIYAFIHNIRLDMTRSDKLSTELDLKCLITSSG